LKKVRAGASTPRISCFARALSTLFLSGFWTASPLPRVSGLEMAGELVEKGEDVTDFAIGDAVAGMSNRFHGGVHAEFALLKADEVALCPLG